MTAPNRATTPDRTAIDPEVIVLAEFEALKEEQQARMGVRDGLPYVVLASLTAVAAGLSSLGSFLLLVVPLACVVLGWRYLQNDEKISHQCEYIRTVLIPYVETRTPAGTPVFGWETFHRSDPRRRSRMVWHVAVDLTTFCLTGIGALVSYWTRPGPWPLIGLSVLELGGLVCLAYQFVSRALLGTPRQRPANAARGVDAR